MFHSVNGSSVSEAQKLIALAIFVCVQVNNSQYRYKGERKHVLFICNQFLINVLRVSSTAMLNRKYTGLLVFVCFLAELK